MALFVLIFIVCFYCFILFYVCFDPARWPCQLSGWQENGCFLSISSLVGSLCLFVFLYFVFLYFCILSFCILSFAFCLFVFCLCILSTGSLKQLLPSSWRILITYTDRRSWLRILITNPDCEYGLQIFIANTNRTSRLWILITNTDRRFDYGSWLRIRIAESVICNL